MSVETSSERCGQFAAMWASNLRDAISAHGITNSTISVSEPITASAPSHEEFEKSACNRFSCGGALRGELLWVVDKSTAVQLAQLMMSQPLDAAAAFSDSHRDAFGEFLRQAAKQTATAWKAEMESEIELSFHPTADPVSVTTRCATVKLAGDKFPETALRLFLDGELCVALASIKFPDTASPPPHAAPVAAVPQAPREALPSNLALVLDVTLDATIRFGEREMLLRDIFGLMAGAVVELNQMVNEPAELHVAGRLVARGEVVVVDGNFGLRVTEVASINERVAAIPW